MDRYTHSHEVLRHDMATFGAHLEEWLNSHPGQYALIHRGQLVNFFSDQDQALETGYREFRREPFLVRRIEPLERFTEVVHALGRCLA